VDIDTQKIRELLDKRDAASRAVQRREGEKEAVVQCVRSRRTQRSHMFKKVRNLKYSICLFTLGPLRRAFSCGQGRLVSVG
jgi:hypothetical protein